jgi:sugar phosphate isomerase/epimerase
VKNGGWFPTKQIQDGQRLWESDWVGIADGMVPWKDILAYLSANKYEGLLSFHSHYQLPLQQALDQTRVDLQFVLRQLQAQKEQLAASQ